MQENDSKKVITEEEERFEKTLKKGMRTVEKVLEKGTITGKEVFILQSTYGFPKELTESIAEKRGITVQQEGYDEAMQEHRKSSRQASEKKFKGGLAIPEEQV